MEEKLKLGLLSQPPNLLLKHNFYCSQKQDISHKLNIQHYTKRISTSTKMEFSSGEKWKEKGNKHRLFFNQKFKNRTSFNGDTDYIIQVRLYEALSIINKCNLKKLSIGVLKKYCEILFFQWHLHYPPRNLDVHTSLKHAHALGNSYSINTSIKVVFNSKHVFNASLQVYEMSANPMWFWNGTLRLDSPWLNTKGYLKLKHKEEEVFSSYSHLHIESSQVISDYEINTILKNVEGVKEILLDCKTPKKTLLKMHSKTKVDEDVSLLKSQNKLVTWCTHPLTVDFMMQNYPIKKLLLSVKHPEVQSNVLARYF
uniref:Uncharacterized protein n=1 Tax=Eptatretus burgeri TaxID=7764 RepID=A0A8C4R5E0_EPTBU